MTVSAAEEMWSRSRGSISSQDGGRNKKATITKGYSVTMDPTDDVTDIAEAAGLPDIGELYPGSSQIRVVDKQPERISPNYGIAIIKWEGEIGPDGLGDSPTGIPPTVKWGTISSDEPIDEDINGRPFANTVGEPVIGLTAKVFDRVAFIERNYAFGAFNLAQLQAYYHAYNSDNIITTAGMFGPGLARLTRFDPEEVFAQEAPGGGYWKVQAEVTFRFPYRVQPLHAWWKRFRNEGFKMRNDLGRVINAPDENGDPVTSPILLKVDGTREPNDRNAHFVEQTELTALPYSALGLF
jgi:hypothetical protein